MGPNEGQDEPGQPHDDNPDTQPTPLAATDAHRATPALAQRRRPGNEETPGQSAGGTPPRGRADSSPRADPRN